MMRQPTELPQRGWMPYVRVLEGAHESGWGLFEVGYVDGNGSRIVLSRKADVVLIEPPGVGKIAIDHDCGSTEVRFGEHDNKGLWPYWLDTKYSTAELGWTEHAPRFAFVQRIANDPAGSQEENPPDRVPFRPQVFDGETAAREAQRFERASVDQQHSEQQRQAYREEREKHGGWGRPRTAREIFVGKTPNDGTDPHQGTP